MQLIFEQLLIQLLFQKLGCISHTARALAQHDMSTHAFQQLTLGGTVLLLEAGHDLPHSRSRFRSILCGHPQDNTCPYKSSTSSFHGSHASAKSAAQVFGSHLINADKVGVGAHDSLGTVVRTALQFLCRYLFSCFHVKLILCCKSMKKNRNPSLCQNWG